jgi:glycosyltransferase involved in cell wall biosynthesis
VTARLSVVVPAYREASRIGRAVERLRATVGGDIGTDQLEIVVVDDGSDDGTDAAAAAAAARVIRLPSNRGKGAAVRAGVLEATGAVVAFTDADLSYAPHHLLTLLAKVESGCDMVVGNRYHPEATAPVRAGVVREVSGRLFNLVTRLLLGVTWRDTQCGLKGFSQEAARLLFAEARVDGFAFDVELLLLADRHRLEVCEIPVALESSAGSTVRLGTDALTMVRDLLALRRDAVRLRRDG